MHKTAAQHGGVSLFIVIFVALIVTVITVSFTQLMLRTQQQTMESDLSQRAYDSAMAGVEDAKRVILSCQSNPGGDACDAIAAQQCDTVQEAGLGIGGTEVQVGEADDGQAYTCVKISRSGRSYTTPRIAEGSTFIVPMTASESYDRITVTWYTLGDANDGLAQADQLNDGTPVASGDYPSLPSQAEWGGREKPPVLRVAFVPGTAGAANLGELSGNYVRTGFLYPFDTGAIDADLIDVGPLEPGATRRSADLSPIAALCMSNFSRVTGVCRATFDVPRGNGGYLQLTPLYHATTVTVQAWDGNTPQNLVGTYQVDSTGRADGLFRRVSASVALTDGVSIPMPTMYVNKNLCKTFTITDDASQFDPGDCDPSQQSTPSTP